ncbi:MAG: FHA domain-containing protein [Chloroflexota bacterium]
MDTDTSAFTLCYAVEGGTFCTVPLTSRPLVLGSAPQADLQIPSRFVAPQHLQIVVRSSCVYLTDLGSYHGTVINGRRLSSRQPFEWYPGDTLYLNDVQLELIDRNARIEPIPIPTRMTVDAPESISNEKGNPFKALLAVKSFARHLHRA